MNQTNETNPMELNQINFSNYYNRFEGVVRTTTNRIMSGRGILQ